jgi:hypothetical protein
LKAIATIVFAGAMVGLNGAFDWSIASPANEIDDEATFVGSGMTDATGAIVFYVFEFDGTEPDFKGDQMASRAGTAGMAMWVTSGDVISPPTGGWVDQSGADLFVELHHSGAAVKSKSVEVND